MSIKYDLFASLPKAEEEDPGVQTRLIYYHTLNINELPDMSGRRYTYVLITN